jgi:hypothetical protein
MPDRGSIPQFLPPSRQSLQGLNFSRTASSYVAKVTLFASRMRAANLHEGRWKVWLELVPTNGPDGVSAGGWAALAGADAAAGRGGAGGGGLDGGAAGEGDAGKAAASVAATSPAPDAAALAGKRAAPSTGPRLVRIMSAAAAPTTSAAQTSAGPAIARRPEGSGTAPAGRSGPGAHGIRPEPEGPGRPARPLARRGAAPAPVAPGSTGSISSSDAHERQYQSRSSSAGRPNRACSGVSLTPHAAQ